MIQCIDCPTCKRAVVPDMGDHVLFRALVTNEFCTLSAQTIDMKRQLAEVRTRLKGKQVGKKTPTNIRRVIEDLQTRESCYAVLIAHNEKRISELRETLNELEPRVST